jgi:phosphatidylglycerophosphatase A
MKINIFEKCLGSGFFTGYIPFASGTFGSLAALLIYYIPGFSYPPVIITAIILLAFYGIYIGTKFEKIYGEDPAECTIDEVVGMWITLLFAPKTIAISLTGFLIWRILDIIKPFPARRAEKLPGGLGIMLDDVIAGTYSLIILQVILIIFRH